MNWNKTPIQKLNVEKIPNQIFVFGKNWKTERLEDGGKFNPDYTGGVIAKAIDIIRDWDEGRLNCIVAE